MLLRDWMDELDRGNEWVKRKVSEKDDGGNQDVLEERLMKRL